MTSFVAVNAFVVIHELPWQQGGARTRSDTELVEVFAATILAVSRSVSTHDARRIVFARPADLYQRYLPGGTRFSLLIDAMNVGRARDLAARLRRFLSGPAFDSEGDCALLGSTTVLGNVTHAGTGQAAGLRLAIAIGGLVLSLDFDPWRQSPLAVEVRSAGSEDARPETISNVWAVPIDVDQLGPIARAARLLPVYENPGHHDPTLGTFIAGKSLLPANARRLLASALSIDGATWWACCEHGFFHRFQGARRGRQFVVHWNGTTNPKAAQVTGADNVPGELRDTLRRSPVEGCGCREV